MTAALFHGITDDANFHQAVGMCGIRAFVPTDIGGMGQYN